MTDNSNQHFLTLKQLQCLATPARYELFAILQQIGPSSVAEIAIALDQPADALYYHLRQLQADGLIALQGKRSARTRHEAVFEINVPLLRIDRTSSTQAYVDAFGKLVNSTLRALGRRMARAIDSSYGDRKLQLHSRLTRITSKQLRDLNKVIEELLESSTHDGEGELVQIVVAMTPVGRPGSSASSGKD